MASKFPKSGANFSPAYQISGVPHITTGDAPVTSTTPSDSLNISFDYVTKNIKLKNTHGSRKLRLAFTASGSLAASKNHIIVSAGETAAYDFRCKDIFLMATAGDVCPFELVAGLTTIPASNFPVLTGSITGSATPRFPDGVIDAFDGVG